MGPTSRDSRVRVARCLLPAVLFAWFAGAGLLAGCGAERGEAPGTAARLAGPPLVEATRITLPEGAHGLNLRAQAACELVLTVEGAGAGAPPVPVQRLAAGEAVRFWWNAVLDPASRSAGEPSVAAVAAGRTQGLVPELQFAYEDGVVRSASLPMHVRPGTPARTVRDYVPPVRPEPLAFGQRLELCTFAIADLDAGAPRIFAASPQNRVLPAPATVSPPQLVRVVRLWLEARALD